MEPAAQPRAAPVGEVGGSLGIPPLEGCDMVIEEMTKHECDAMLLRTHVARLACAWNNQP